MNETSQSEARFTEEDMKTLLGLAMFIGLAGENFPSRDAMIREMQRLKPVTDRMTNRFLSNLTKMLEDEW